MEKMADVQSPFDSALQTRYLREAAEEYALTHGDPGTPEYRVAWICFRQRIRSDADLRQWRVAQAKRDARRTRGERVRARASA